MSKASMTSRQRVLAALSHTQGDRPPFTWGFGPQPPAIADLDKYLAQWNMDFAQLQRRTSDIRRIVINPSEGSCPPGKSIWGYGFKAVSYGAGEYEEFTDPPLAEIKSVDQVAQHPWPDPQANDYQALAEAVGKARADGDRAISLTGGNPFEIMTWMMGLENCMVMLLSEPEIIHATMARITDYFVETLRLQFETVEGPIDFIFCADDLGTQNGLMISRNTYREMIMPYHIRLFEACHKSSPYVMLHSDGAVFDVLGDLIEAGLDCHEAVQVECRGMNPQRLKRTYGDRLSFQGAVSVQQILPAVSADEVRREVRRLKSILGAGGGYICAPSHAIQAGTPPENVIAMVEEAAETTIDEIASR